MTEIRDAQTKRQKTVPEILPTPVRTYKDRIFSYDFQG